MDKTKGRLMSDSVKKRVRSAFLEATGVRLSMICLDMMESFSFLPVEGSSQINARGRVHVTHKDAGTERSCRAHGLGNWGRTGRGAAHGVAPRR